MTDYLLLLAHNLDRSQYPLFTRPTYQHMVIYSYHFVILVSFCVIILIMSRLDKRTRQRLKALKRAKNFAPNTPKSTSIVQVKKTKHFESSPFKAKQSRSGQPVKLAIKDASKPLQPRKSTPEELTILSKLSTPNKPTALESALIATKWGTTPHNCRTSHGQDQLDVNDSRLFMYSLVRQARAYTRFIAKNIKN